MSMTFLDGQKFTVTNNLTHSKIIHLINKYPKNYFLHTFGNIIGMKITS